MEIIAIIILFVLTCFPSYNMWIVEAAKTPMGLPIPPVAKRLPHSSKYIYKTYNIYKSVYKYLYNYICKYIYKYINKYICKYNHIHFSPVANRLSEKHQICNNYKSEYRYALIGTRSENFSPMNR